jgi:hypothetical protein
MKSKHVFRNALIMATLFCLAFAAATQLRSVAAQEVAASSLYLAHLNAGEGWRTTINLLNCESNPVALRLTSYDEFGRELGVFPGLSELAGQQTLALDGAVLVSGTATLKIETQGRIVANARLVSADGTQAEAIPALNTARRLVFPLLPSDSLAQNRFTLLNTGAEAAYLELVALNRDGGELMRATLPPLEAMASRSVTPDEIFRGIGAGRVEPADGHTRRAQPEVASVRLISDQPVAGLQVIEAPRGDLLALPALAAGSRALTFYLPRADEAPELQAAVWLFNPGEQPGSVSIEAFDAENQSLGLIEQSELQPGALQAIASPAQGAVSLRVQADQPVCGYQTISAVQGRGQTAVLGIAQEEQTVVGYELTAQPDGGALAAYALARLADGSLGAAYEREATALAQRLGQPSEGAQRDGGSVVNAISALYAVSGRVTLSNGVGLAGVTISFQRSGTGALPASVQTDVNGNWRQAGFNTGSTYQARPNKSGYAFTPGSRNFSGPSTTLNFTGAPASPASYIAAGRVTNTSGAGIGGVTITFSRVSGSGQIPNPAQTDANGNWAGLFVSGTTYRATPSKSGYAFDPVSRDFNSSSTTLNFTGVPLPSQLYSVSGRVTTGSGAGLSGVTLTFRIGSSPGPASAQTDANGNWSKSGFSPFTTYTVTPSKPGYTFTPTSRSFNAPSTTLNFTSSP